VTPSRASTIRSYVDDGDAADVDADRLSPARANSPVSEGTSERRSYADRVERLAHRLDGARRSSRRVQRADVAQGWRSRPLHACRPRCRTTVADRGEARSSALIRQWRSFEHGPQAPPRCPRASVARGSTRCVDGGDARGSDEQPRESRSRQQVLGSAGALRAARTSQNAAFADCAPTSGTHRVRISPRRLLTSFRYGCKSVASPRMASRISRSFIRRLAKERRAVEEIHVHRRASDRRCRGSSRQPGAKKPSFRLQALVR